MNIKAIYKIKENRYEGVYEVDLEPDWLERLFKIKPTTIRFIHDGYSMMGGSKWINCTTKKKVKFIELDELVEQRNINKTIKHFNEDL